MALRRGRGSSWHTRQLNHLELSLKDSAEVLFERPIRAPAGGGSTKTLKEFQKLLTQRGCELRVGGRRESSVGGRT